MPTPPPPRTVADAAVLSSPPLALSATGAAPPPPSTTLPLGTQPLASPAAAARFDQEKAQAPASAPRLYDEKGGPSLLPLPATAAVPLSTFRSSRGGAANATTTQAAGFVGEGHGTIRERLSRHWSRFCRKLKTASLTNSVTGGGTASSGMDGHHVGHLVAERTTDGPSGAGLMLLRFTNGGGGGARGAGKGNVDQGDFVGAAATRIAADVARREKRRLHKREKDGNGGRSTVGHSTAQDSVFDQTEGEEEERGLKVDCVVIDGDIDSSDEWYKKFENGPLSKGSVPIEAADGPRKSHTGSHSAEHPHDYSEALLQTGLGASVRDFLDLGHKNSPKDERAYQSDAWANHKRVAVFGSLFYTVLWLATMIFTPRPFNVVNKVFYYAITPLTSIPLPFIVIYDIPNKRKWGSFYQIWLAVATWQWPLSALADLKYCGYYTDSPRCYGRDFTGLAYSYTALPTIQMLAMGGIRSYHIVCSVIMLTLLGTIAAPLAPTWIRNSINFGCYCFFTTVCNYLKEKADRRVFLLRYELKKQAKATQSAMAREDAEGASKKRFISYIFHEVRVPLNTALLAVQNLESANVFEFEGTKEHDLEVHALTSSLVQVQNVLNDVLDFQRMNDGRFETVSRPFILHRSIRSMTGATGVMALSKDVAFEYELDPRIDEFIANSRAKSGDAWGLMEHVEKDENGKVLHEGVVFGDEMRMRQIISNLTSNAVKFVPNGGQVNFRTKLVYPIPGLGSMDSDSPTLSSQLDQLRRKEEADRIVVRFEIQDSGPGIDQADLRDARLFSPYVQTEIGRQQGGKGTGLGLALVRHIVRLSRGRLGVISKKGEGSTFWFELPFELYGGAAHAPPSRPPIGLRGDTSSTSNDHEDGVAAQHRKLSVREVEFATGSSMISTDPFRPILLEEGPTPPGSVSWRTTAPDPLTRRPTYHTSVPGSSFSSAAPLLGAPSVSSPSHGAYASASTTSTSIEPASLLLPPSGSTLIESPFSLPEQTEPMEALGTGAITLAAAEEAETPVTAPGSVSSRATFRSTGLTPMPSSSPSMAATPFFETPAAPGPTTFDNTSSSVSPAMVEEGLISPHTVPKALAATPSFEPLSPPLFSPTLLSPTLLSPTLPATAAPSSSRRRSSADRPPAKTKTSSASEPVVPTLRVLIVDDDAMTRKLMNRMLSRMGHECSEAEDGKMALQMLGCSKSKPAAQEPPRWGPYDIVYLDNWMPLATGVEVVSLLRSRSRIDFVIGCTGNALKGDQEEYRAAGVDELLTKPIVRADLYRTTQMADSRRRARNDTTATVGVDPGPVVGEPATPSAAL